MSIFTRRTVRPQLLGESREPFDDENYIFELKFDGMRAVAFLGDNSTYIINRNARDISSTKFPELNSLHNFVKENNTAVLDGEIVALTNGKPDFFALQKRALMNNPSKIMHLARTMPTQFVAFDILHYNGEDLTCLPLTRRKEILQDVILQNDLLAVSKYVEGRGTALYEFAKKEKLEGIVAKEKNSTYNEGARSNAWRKIKVLQDEDFIIVGYIIDESSAKIKSLWLACNNNGVYKDKGLHNFNLSAHNSDLILKHSQILILEKPSIAISEKNIAQFALDNNVVWLKPKLVCIISYLEKTQSGSMRMPVYKGLRID